MKKPTLVIGASTNPERYSFKAVSMLLKHEHPVFAIGLRSGNIQNVEIQKGKPQLHGIHTVTLYVNPLSQEFYADYIIGIKPPRIIFNPGTWNDKLAQIASKQGIEVVDGCTLVMLTLGNY